MSRELDNIITGTHTCGTIATPIISYSGVCHSIIIQNQPSNKNNVFIGDSNNQYTELTPGQFLPIQMNNPKVLYGRCNNNTNLVNWICVKFGMGG